MTKNMGNIDRGLRLVLGVILLIGAFFTGYGATGWPHWVMIVVGAILALTALIGSCPLYAVFGIRTCRR